MEAKVLAGTLDALAPLRDYVTAAATQAGLDRKATYNLCLAVDEIATNIVVHGYEEAGRTGNLRIASAVEQGRLTIILEDQGVPYDPHDRPLPNAAELAKPLEERKAGGLGIFLALKGVDEIRYESARGMNRTVFLVHLPGPEPAHDEVP